MVPVLTVKPVKVLRHRAPVVLRRDLCRHLRKHSSGSNSVLVLVHSSEHEPDGFLESEKHLEPLRLQIFGDVAQPLEASQRLAEHEPLLRGHSGEHLRRNRGCQHCHRARIFAGVACFPLRPRPVRQQRANLISAEAAPVALGGAAGGHLRCGEAVRVRVVGDADRRARCRGCCEGLGPRGTALLGVGEYHSGELGVRRHLRRHRNKTW
mmetsp:Transcript_9359/g.23044  ORF Transcript_9359/g.23044 Transcript_9359/m.23044 type:complete len:209 (-) Transcript_9359:208-834(-)